MLGALILQVMDKEDVESLKVMIFLIEGCLPPGYFNGSLGKYANQKKTKRLKPLIFVISNYIFS